MRTWTRGNSANIFALVWKDVVRPRKQINVEVNGLFRAIIKNKNATMLLLFIFNISLFSLEGTVMPNQIFGSLTINDEDNMFKSYWFYFSFSDNSNLTISGFSSFIILFCLTSQFDLDLSSFCLHDCLMHSSECQSNEFWSIVCLTDVTHAHVLYYFFGVWNSTRIVSLSSHAVDCRNSCARYEIPLLQFKLATQALLSSLFF